MSEIVVETISREDIIELGDGTVLETTVAQELQTVISVPAEPVIIDLNSGARGEPGSAILAGETWPSIAVGTQGDAYVVTGTNEDTGTFLIKGEFGWQNYGNIRGPAGGINTINGKTGPDAILIKSDIGLGLVPNLEGDKMKAQTFSASVSTGWVRIASQVGGKGSATFKVWDDTGSAHNFVEFSVVSTYNNIGGGPELAPQINVLQNTSYGALTITGVRVARNASAGFNSPVYLEVEVTSALTYGLNVTMTNNFGDQPWTLLTPSNTALPTGYTTFTTAALDGKPAIKTTGSLHVAGIINGNGSAITALNGSNISTGTISDARLSSGVMLLGNAQTVAGSKTFTSATLIAAGFGNNTARPAVTNARISGEISGYGQSPAADDGFLRLSAGGGTGAGSKTYIDLSGYSQVADMNATIVFGVAGAERGRMTNSAFTLTIPITTSQSVTAATFSGNGSSLIALNGSNISTGTVADARLSTNVVLATGNQTIAGTKTFSSEIIGGNGLTGNVLRVGNDSRIVDIDAAHAMAIISTTDVNRGELRLGSNSWFTGNGSAIGITGTSVTITGTTTMSGSMVVNGNLTLGTTDIYQNMPTGPAAGGWARGHNFRNIDGSTVLAAVGMYGLDNTVGHIYFSHGTAPWDATLGLKISTNGAATFSHGLTAAQFNGSGAGITALNADNLISGVVPNGQLPARLKASAAPVPNNDWNDAVENGWYNMVGGLNSPTAGNTWYMGEVIVHDGAANNRWVTQKVFPFTTWLDPNYSGHFERRSAPAGGNVTSWSPWRRVYQYEGELDARYARLDSSPSFTGNISATGGHVYSNGFSTQSTDYMTLNTVVTGATGTAPHYGVGGFTYNDGNGSGPNTSVSGYFGISFMTGAAHRMRINYQGGVSILTPLTTTQSISLDQQKLKLYSQADEFNYVQYVTDGDGPRMVGFEGGTLGRSAGGTYQERLRWKSSGIDAYGRMTIVPVTVNFDSGGSALEIRSYDAGAPSIYFHKPGVSDGVLRLNPTGGVLEFTNAGGTAYQGFAAVLYDSGNRVYSASNVPAISAVSGLQAALNLKAPLADPTFTGLIRGNGSAITDLYANNITSGTVQQNRLVQNVVQVVHGTIASTARPTGATFVHWVGTVAPTNATSNDIWWNA